MRLASVIGWLSGLAILSVTVGCRSVGLECQEAVLPGEGGEEFTAAFSTFIGGSDGEFAFAVAADDECCVYITGYTHSKDFPVRNGYQNVLQADEAAFVTKLASDGMTPVWSTYLAGSAGGSEGFAIQVDSARNSYVNGATTSADFPTVNPYQASQTGSWDGVAFKLSSSGSSLVYSTYLGGNGDDWTYKSALDSEGNLYFAGKTTSDNFPLVNPYQSVHSGGWDAVVVKLSSTGSSLDFSTYLGTGCPDIGEDVSLGPAGIYVIGNTGGGDFPTKNPYQPVKAGADDAFLTILSTSGSDVIYSTFLGGSGYETGRGIAVDRDGEIYAAGACGSDDFPLLNAYQDRRRSGDTWVTKLASSGSALVFSTLLGGSSSDTSKHIAVDDQENIFLPGHTNSTDFPTVNPFQASLNRNYDAFVSILKSSGSALLFSTYLGGAAKDEHWSCWVDREGSMYISGQTRSDDFPTFNPFQSSFGGMSDGFVAKFKPVAPLPPSKPSVGAAPVPAPAAEGDRKIGR